MSELTADTTSWQRQMNRLRLYPLLGMGSSRVVYGGSLGLMRYRGMVLFSVIVIILSSALYLIAYWNRKSGEPTLEEMEMEHKLASLPLRTPTPVPLSPTPTPIAIEDDVNTDRLIELLYDKEHYGNDPDRARAARRLGVLGAKSAIPVLLEMLNDTTWFSSEEIRDACAIALGQTGDPEAETDLVNALKGGRASAARALSILRTDMASAEILKHFQEIQDSTRSQDRQMILTLIDILGDLKLTNSVDPLARAVEQQDHEIGSAALGALRNIGDVRAVPKLILLDQTEEPIRSGTILTINDLLLKERDFSLEFSDDFSTENNDKWNFHRDYHRSGVAEDGFLSLFSSIPNDRIEQLSNLIIHDDFSLEVGFRKIKGRPDAEFGVLIGDTETGKLAFALKLLYDNQQNYFQVEVSSVIGPRSSPIFRNRSMPTNSTWSRIQIRVIDSIVTVFLNDSYIQSFQSNDCHGRIGFYLIGENHVVLDDLLINNISGPKILSAKAEESLPQTEIKSTAKSTVPVSKETEPKHKVTAEPSDHSGKTGQIIIDIKAEYVSVNEVIFKLDGEMIARVSGDNLQRQATKGLFNFRTIFSGRTQKDITPGRHTLSGYVVRKKQTGGASTTFDIAPGKTKQFSFVSEKDKDEIVAK